MSASAPTRRPLPLQAVDLQGLARLATDATIGVVDLVENLHHTIVRVRGPLGAATRGPAPGMPGLVYRAVRGGARLAGRGADALLGLATGQLPGNDSPPARDAALAVLNGIWGNHLEAGGNPLAIPMRLRQQAQAIDLDRDALAQRFPAAGSRLLVMVHGLCMNDLQWLRDGHDHGQALARDHGLTSLYLHYNTGRHVSSNGRDLAALLERLVARWPVPVTELVLIGHSMGGLVMRSACHLAQQQAMAWPGALRAMVFLGTPHHGAPLERGGLGSTACWTSAPTARRLRAWAGCAAPASPTCASATCRTATGSTAAATTSAATTACRRRCRPASTSTWWRPPPRGAPAIRCGARRCGRWATWWATTAWCRWPAHWATTGRLRWR
jgi:hypothetical protein